ncbi:MAG: hypothetical protein ACREQ5_24235 [Candidatus Dormibacteria bacterium]
MTVTFGPGEPTERMLDLAGIVRGSRVLDVVGPREFLVGAETT